MEASEEPVNTAGEQRDTAQEAVEEPSQRQAASKGKKGKNKKGKNKSKKGQKRAGNEETKGSEEGEGMASMTREQMLQFLLGQTQSTQPKEHRFWNTQPVVQDEAAGQEGAPTRGEEGEEIVPEGVNGPIEVQTVEEVRQEPLAMPAGFEWSTIDVSSEEQLTDVYDLLTNNYVEDNDASFRFDYSTDFLTWALTPPGFSSDLHIGVRASKSGKLVGFISGVPSQMRVNGEPVEMVEINFLCVHKKLRDKRLAPVLIREVTRRVNLTGVWQAVYTAGVRLPRPVSACRYFHRSLNPKKLVDIGFSHLSRSMTMTRLIRLNKLPSAPLCERLRPMEPVDVPAVTALLNEYLSKFKLSQVFTEDEIAHYLLPRPGVIQTMVVPGEEAGEVTDFFSFYFLNSHVMKHDKHNMLYAVYSYYTVATSMSREELIRNALIVARDQEADVFNCLNLQDNQEFIENLRFGRGDGNLHYYLFNWQCPTMSPEDIGLILL